MNLQRSELYRDLVDSWGSFELSDADVCVIRNLGVDFFAEIYESSVAWTEDDFELRSHNNVGYFWSWPLGNQAYMDFWARWAQQSSPFTTIDDVVQSFQRTMSRDYNTIVRFFGIIPHLQTSCPLELKPVLRWLRLFARFMADNVVFIAGVRILSELRVTIPDIVKKSRLYFILYNMFYFFKMNWHRTGLDTFSQVHDNILRSGLPTFNELYYPRKLIGNASILWKKEIEYLDSAYSNKSDVDNANVKVAFEDETVYNFFERREKYKFKV